VESERIRHHFVLSWLVVSAVSEAIAVCVAFLMNIASQIGAGAVLGAFVGCIMALPQAVVLRNRVDRPVWWIAARALAWCIALPSLLLAGGLLAAVSGAGLPVVILALLMTFGGAAAFVGSVEGIVLERLLHSRAVAVR
jgi:hypothetical protein